MGGEYCAQILRKMFIEIRRAITREATAITEITLAAKRHWDYPEKWIQLWLPKLTFSPEYISENEMWLAVVDDMSVGYYSFKLQPVIARSGATKQSSSMIRGLLRREEHPPRNDGDYHLWLENLWVLPDHMGQGIGRMLFQHALERSRAQGVFTLKIEADPNAQSFYEKMGAQKVGEHRYELDGQLRVLPIMEINL